jgi:hypothetical protein
MQFQVQSTISKDVQKDAQKDAQKEMQKQSDSLDLFVGLKSGLDDPFNVFLRVDDLKNNKDVIYFYAYSLGKKKAIIWGVFDKVNNEFLVDSACKYQPNDLKQILTNWNKNNYSYYFNTVRNRISSRVNQEMIFDDREKETTLFGKFQEYFIAHLIKEGLISSNDSIKNTLSKKETFDSEYDNILSSISTEMVKYIKNVNKDEYSDVMNVIYEQINTQGEIDILKSVLKGNKINVQDPYLKNVMKYLLTNLFILIFADINVYRTAKYILFLHEKENNKIKKQNREEIIRELRKQFFFAWMIELSRILRVYDVPRFMKNYSQSIVNLLENSVNRSDIRSDSSNFFHFLSDLSIFFEDFISKSVYSKISYVNQLKDCPNLSICENDETCSFSKHGLIESQYDLR